MTKVFSKPSITAIAIATIFILSPLGSATLLSTASAATPASASPALASTPLTQIQANWASPAGNALGQDYNPQTQINSSNAQYLGLNWLFPLPAHPTALLSVSGGLGVDTALLIINGTVYAAGQDGVIFALNAATGDQIWKQTLPLETNSTTGQDDGALSLHLHDGAEQFTTATIGTKITAPTYWIDAPDHVVWAMNAATGAYELNFSDYGVCSASTITNAQPTQVGGGVNAAGDLVGPTATCGVTEIAGNNPDTVYATLATNILINHATGTMITSMLGSSSNNSARCFYEEWNLAATPLPTINWTTYCSPPQPGSNLPVNPNWDMAQVQSMTGAGIFYPGPAYNGGGTIPSTAEVNLLTLSPSQLNATLYNDWGYVQSAHCASEDANGAPGGTGSGWGQQWLLGTGPTAGMAFVNTGNKGPYNGDCQPGPDLWASSVLALNMNTGAWVWGFQTSAHDEWDWDCSWWQGLGNETVNGVANTQVLFKTCKSGYLFELNAQTGALVWAYTPVQSILARCSECYMLNPLNSTQMNEAFFNPSLATALMYPTADAGFENAPSYNPALNMIFTASQNVPLDMKYVQFNATNYGHGNGDSSVAIAATAAANDNSTVEGINAATGAQVWDHFVTAEGYRGGITSSGGVVFLTFSSGDILMLNAQTGATLKDYYVGGPLNVIPSIGATSAGVEEVIFPITAGLVTWGTGVPGDIVALTLQAPSGTSTVTSTATSTTTSTSTAATTVTVGSTTVTVGAGSTTTITVAGITSTITGPTTTVAAQTITSTATNTSSTGVSSTTLYGVAAVAVIFIIATGYLAMRGRKPAS
jgi:outer membrane protein assembly factor BamB